MGISDITNKVINSLNPLPSLNDFYESFSTSQLAGDPTFILASNNKFSLAMFCNDCDSPPNAITSLAAKTLGPSIFGQIIGGNFGAAATLSFLGMIAENIDLPDISTQDGDYPTPGNKGITDFGYQNFPGKFMIPDENEFQVTFTDTEFSPVDSFFYQWLSQTTSTEWAYIDKPFMTASILITPITQSPTLNKFQGGDLNIPRQIYTILRCFPSKIGLPKFDINSEPGESKRTVTFKFSKLIIIPNFSGYAEFLAFAKETVEDII